MSDEELLIKYRNYKKERMIIIFSIILIFMLLARSYLYFHFNNTSSPDSEEPKEEIKVKDEVAPIIKLKVDSIEILKGDDISYLDYIDSVVDDIDGDLLEKIEYEEIDTSIIGEQSMVYNVSDSAGNTSQAILQVLVKDEEVIEENTQTNAPSSGSTQTQQTKEPSKNSGNNSSNNNTPKTEQPTTQPVQEETKPEPKSSGKIVKYFLFSDGYTMMNVADACAAELKKTNRTGMCSPIQDENGIYLGMKLETE